MESLHPQLGAKQRSEDIGETDGDTKTATYTRTEATRTEASRSSAAEADAGPTSPTVPPLRGGPPPPCVLPHADSYPSTLENILTPRQGSGWTSDLTYSGLPS